VLDMVEWLFSPRGWLTTTWLALYLVMSVSGLYDVLTAIAFSGLLTVVSTALLFESDESLPW
ncbi:MAG: hypothetical protein F6K09_13795, partial [Merismopedia sp. SIO2A8]|nr:hypothetical protein [Merismopedia sp. SIO2A8]